MKTGTESGYFERKSNLQIGSRYTDSSIHLASYTAMLSAVKIYISLLSEGTTAQKHTSRPKITHPCSLDLCKPLHLYSCCM